MRPGSEFRPQRFPRARPPEGGTPNIRRANLLEIIQMKRTGGTSFIKAAA